MFLNQQLFEISMPIPKGTLPKNIKKFIEASKKTQFKKKHKPWNKNTKGLTGPNSTSFKKGNTAREKHWNWNGGKAVISGYILILKPEHPFADKRGYVFEHRLVMEEKIGRCLTLEERVHHKNGIRNDNRPENLRLFANHSEHMKSEYGFIEAGKPTRFKKGNIPWNKKKKGDA